MAKKLGDIKTLYAYYRFSDYGMTNIGLTEKFLSKEEVWFEGFMDWTFTKCIFNKPFHFGVEGAKLEEDTRGTTENPTPFPGYGSNGLHFNTCAFNEAFEIKDNCVVVFKDCSIGFAEGESIPREVPGVPGGPVGTAPAPVVIEDGCRVEFIGCSIEKPIELRDFCEVRFRNCTFKETTYSLLVENHCKVMLDNCTQAENSEIFLEVNNDCEVTLNSIPQIRSEGKNILVTESSVVKLFTCNLMETFKNRPGDPGASVIDVQSGSKFEARYVDTIRGSKQAIVGNQAEFFMQDIGAITVDKDAKGTVVDLEDSLWRSRRINDIDHINEGYAIHAVNTQFSLNEFETIQSKTPTCIVGEDASFEIHNGDLIQTKVGGVAIHLTGEGRSIFHNIATKIKGCSAAIKLTDGPEVYVDTVNQIISTVASAIVMEGNSSLEVLNVVGEEGEIKGLFNGIFTYGENNRLRVKNVQEVIRGETLDGIDLTNTLYDLQDIPLITGFLKGAELTNCQGLVSNLGVVEGQTEEGCHIVGISGPTDWDTVTEIYSPMEPGLRFEGGAAQTRMANITEIHSEIQPGMVWDQTGGIATFYDCGSIYSLEEAGARITLAAGSSLEMKRVDYVYSLLLEGMVVTCSGEANFYNGKEIYSEEEKGLVVTTSGVGKVGVHTYDKIWSLEQTALNLNLAAGTSTRFYKVDEISSEEGNAIDGSASGRLSVSDTTTIKTELGVAVKLTSAARAFIRFEDIDTIRAETPPDDLFEITGCGNLQIHRVGEFAVDTSERYLCYLTGPGGNYGRCEVIDCLSWTGSEVRGGLYMRDFFRVEAICSREKGSMSFEKATGVVFGVVNCNGAVANWSEIKDQSGEGLNALYTYGISTGAPHKLEFWNIDEIEGNKAVTILTDGVVNLHNLGTIKSPNGDGPALSMEGSGEVRVQRGASGKITIEAKDNDTDAIKITELARVIMIGVDTGVSKGSITIDDALQVQFYDCTLKGTIKPTNSNVEFFGSETTSGYDVNESAVSWTQSDIKVGQDDGTEKEFKSEECAFHMMRCTLDGSENVSIGDSDLLMMHVSGGFSGEFNTTDGGQLLMGCDLSSASKFTGGTTNAIVALFCDLPDAELGGAFLALAGTVGDLDMQGDGGFISVAHTVEDLTTQAKDAVIACRTSIASVDAGAETALIFNGVEVTSTTALGADNAAIFNAFDAQSTVSAGSDNAVFANWLTTAGDFSAGSNNGLVVNWGDIGGALNVHGNSGAFLALVESTGKIDIPSGSAVIGANLDATSVDLDGNAVIAGTTEMPTGDGQGIALSASALIADYMLNLDGRSELRTGLLMDAQYVHMFNNEGHNGYIGNGSAFVMGAKGGGTDASPGVSYDARAQLRTGSYIYDITSADIHHQLPGIID